MISQKLKGKICQWDDDKGYGFIEPCLPGPRMFVHIGDFVRKPKRPQAGDLVVYQLGQGPDGKKRAVQVIFSHQDVSAAAAAPPARSRASNLFALIFCSCFAFAALLEKIPLLLVWLYLGLSVWTFVLYWWDKRAARRQRWRVSEASLLWFGLCGGWPGAVLAQQWLRHKSAKASFRDKFWGTAGLNLCLLLLWYSKGFAGLPAVAW